MNRLLYSRLAGLGVLLGLCVAAGCSGKKTVPLAPVSGKVTVDGQPLTDGIVTFIPDLGEAPHRGKTKLHTPGLSAGKIESDGTYTIYTDGESGAPLGKYRVMVMPPTMPTPEGKKPTGDFDKKYSDSVKTDLKREVIANPEAGRYDLKLTK